MTKKFSSFMVTILLLLFGFNSFANQKITVFAAASLTNAMQEIATLYQSQHHDTKITYSFASSSVLARQITQGAPADIFISANQTWMDYLNQKNIITNKEVLLKNTLVLIAPSDSVLSSVIISKTTDWSTLAAENEKIAVGDPDHVPAGLYAKESLTNLGFFEQLKIQLIKASNVRDALMFVERGEAVLGIVYSTDAKISQRVKSIATFPTNSYRPIEYPMTLLNKQAQNFYNFLKTKQAKVIFEKYGFITQ